MMWVWYCSLQRYRQGRQEERIKPPLLFLWWFFFSLHLCGCLSIFIGVSVDATVDRTLLINVDAFPLLNDTGISDCETEVSPWFCHLLPLLLPFNCIYLSLSFSPSFISLSQFYPSSSTLLPSASFPFYTTLSSLPYTSSFFHYYPELQALLLNTPPTSPSLSLTLTHTCTS